MIAAVVRWRVLCLCHLVMPNGIAFVIMDGVCIERNSCWRAVNRLVKEVLLPGYSSIWSGVLFGWLHQRHLGLCDLSHLLRNVLDDHKPNIIFVYSLDCFVLVPVSDVCSCYHLIWFWV